MSGQKICPKCRNYFPRGMDRHPKGECPKEKGSGQKKKKRKKTKK